MADATILMVDDNPVNLLVLRSVLAKEGYELIAADSGQAALDLARANPRFDLILLDVRMPDLNGIEVCRELRADPTTAHMPIVLVSALQTDDASVREGYSAGADGYLAKPVDDAAVKAWVKAVLRMNEILREAAAEAGSLGATAREARMTCAQLAASAKRSMEAIYAQADMLAAALPEGSAERERADKIAALTERTAKLVMLASQSAEETLAGKHTPAGSG